MKHDKYDIVYNITTTRKSKAIEDSNDNNKNLKAHSKDNQVLLDNNLYENTD